MGHGNEVFVTYFLQLECWNKHWGICAH